MGKKDNIARMNKRALIADENVSFIEVLQFDLASRGVECIVAYDGLEALRRARQDRPDLIILSASLPRINGYKVSRLLKFDEKYKYIPLIMLTTRARERDRNLAQETGADELLVKSGSFDDIWQVISKYLE
ncbi:MAG: response regulator [Deltaproteobacteria bacterium]|nr:MAG: response regulator [Deltaproteobacteria bacterium]